MQARITVETNRLWLERGSRIRRRIDHWIELGAEPVEVVPGHLRATLIVLEGKNGPEYWFGFHNFHVITEYNHSTNYAMAVYQLSQDVVTHRQKTVQRKRSP
jgi:membrane-bound lytic murein transglycosylase B